MSTVSGISLNIVNQETCKGHCLVPSDFFQKKSSSNLYRKAEELQNFLLNNPDDQAILGFLNQGNWSLPEQTEVLALVAAEKKMYDPILSRLHHIKYLLIAQECKIRNKPGKIQRLPPSELSKREGDLINPNPFFSDKVTQYLYGVNGLNSIPINEQNYSIILQCIKYVDLIMDRDPTEMRKCINTSYFLRTLCLKASHGKLSTYEAYTKSMNPENFRDQFSLVARNYAAVPDHYVSERVGMQIHVLLKVAIDVYAMSKRFQNDNPCIYALRGNTASGKSHSVKSDPAFSRGLDDNGESTGALNPDAVKALLRKEVSQVTNQQVHTEGAVLSNKVTDEFLEQRTGSSIVIDKLLAQITDFLPMLSHAKKSRRVVVIKDIDAPLAISALRVLTRNPNLDPCTHIAPIITGFSRIRNFRKDIIESVIRSPEVQNYELHVLNEQGKSGFAARKKMDSKSGVSELEIIDQELFEYALSNPAREIEELASKTVGELASRYGNLVKTPLLDPYKDLPIEKALHQHMNVMPQWEKRVKQLPIDNKT